MSTENIPSFIRLTARYVTPNGTHRRSHFVMGEKEAVLSAIRHGWQNYPPGTLLQLMNGKQRWWGEIHGRTIIKLDKETWLAEKARRGW